MIDTSNIKTKSDFLGYLTRVTPKNKDHIYKRVFDKERVIKITGTNWEATQLWLNRNIDFSKNPKLYLLEIYKAVELEHEYQQSLNWDQWNENRFKEFENWLFFQLDLRINTSLVEPVSSELILDGKFIGLSSYQKALKQWYLEQYEGETKLQGREIGKVLMQASCEGVLNEIRKYFNEFKKHNYSKRGVAKDFDKVKESLINYHIALKAITNDIDINLT